MTGTVSSSATKNMAAAACHWAGLMPGTDVSFELDGGAVRLVKAEGRNNRSTRGERLVGGLDGAGCYGMSTDEILALMRGPSAEDEFQGRE